MSVIDVSELISKWEKHLNEKIIANYKRILEKRDSFKAVQDEYLQLKNSLENISELKLSSMTTQVDLGQLTFCSAHIQDTSKVTVLVGLGIFAELTMPEALDFLDSKIKLLQGQIDGFSEPLARCRKDIIDATEHLGRLQNI